MNLSRKDFLKLVGTGTLAVTTPWSATDLKSSGRRSAENLTLGLASYTLRMFSLAEMIKMAQRLNLKHVALKSMHMPLKATEGEIKAIAAKVRAAGLQLYGAGVIYMRSEKEVKNAFDYARYAGLEVIIGVPDHELLPLAEEQVKATGIKLAIHNHGPGDELYSSPDDVYEKVKGLDARIGLCIDIGHVVRIGQDPVEKAKAYADRLYDVHLKDVDLPAAEGKSVEFGRGLVDIPAFIRVLDEIQYQGVMAVEFEKDSEDPLPGLAESIGYARGVMDVLG